MHTKFAALCIAAILIPGLIPPAASAQRCLSIIPDTSVVVIHMEVSIDVVVNDPVDSLMGYNITVGFDRSYLEVVSVEEGSLPQASGHSTFFRWLNEACACDSIVVNGSILGTTVDGPGTLFTITFKAIAPGRIPIPILRSDLRNGMNEKLALSSEDGCIVVEPPIGIEPYSWGSVKSLYK